LFDNTGEELRRIGREFGATTGRPRRCGWLDLPALKYAAMLNGVTQLMMMKSDVLSGFETIKVCTHYNYDGKTTDIIPYDSIGENIIPVYKEFKGFWIYNILYK
jgi:adenylosuccinate synthase